ncbi:hypothetical protein OG558_14700 [Kribbella sp. NBC_01510]|uniref:hypothetical protein n=1 Tax=Kribbella sp. NBC_01510 TaxID=2903581 RepID=UPI00386AE435
MSITRASSLNRRRDLRAAGAPDNQRHDGLIQVGARMASRPSMSLWFVMAADLATVIWMHTVGSWLDRTSKFTATATLGGHHIVVLVLAAIGFAILATLAILTDGFTRSTPRLSLARNVACIISVVALTGLLALILAGLLSRILFGRLRPGI